MRDLYLYHATDRANLSSILKHGLLINPPSHAYASFGESCLYDRVFLAFNAESAYCYAECSDNEPEDIVVLKISYTSLNSECFGYDWNNRCEYLKEINSCVYRKDIPARFIEICEPCNEPDYDLDRFEGTELYDIITDIFYYEVETNKEERLCF